MTTDTGAVEKVLALAELIVNSTTLIVAGEKQQLARALIAEHAARVAAEAALVERIARLQAPLVATLEDERQTFRDVQASRARLQAVAVAARDAVNGNLDVSVRGYTDLFRALAALQPGDLPT